MPLLNGFWRDNGRMSIPKSAFGRKPIANTAHIKRSIEALWTSIGVNARWKEKSVAMLDQGTIECGSGLSPGHPYYPENRQSPMDIRCHHNSLHAFPSPNSTYYVWESHNSNPRAIADMELESYTLDETRNQECGILLQHYQSTNPCLTSWTCVGRTVDNSMLTWIRWNCSCDGWETFFISRPWKNC